MQMIILQRENGIILIFYWLLGSCPVRDILVKLSGVYNPEPPPQTFPQRVFHSVPFPSDTPSLHPPSVAISSSISTNLNNV